MKKNLLAILKPVNLFLLTTGNFLGLAIIDYLGYKTHWSGFWNGLLFFLLISIGSSFMGNYFQVQSSSLLTEDRKKTEIMFLVLMLGVAFLAISIIPIFSLVRNHLINPFNALFISMGIIIIALVEILPTRISQWGLEEFFRAFLFANLIPALAFSLQANIYHRLIFLLTFPLFFFFLSFFIVGNISAVHETPIESSGSLIRKIGSFPVLRMHNLSLLMGYLILLAGTFFELPWKLIWPALMTIPIGLLQIWQINQILDGKKPNLTALEFTAATIAIFTTYFSILALWLN
jgi:hypothetical protein